MLWQKPFCVRQQKNRTAMLEYVNRLIVQHQKGDLMSSIANEIASAW